VSTGELISPSQTFYYIYTLLPTLTLTTRTIGSLPLLPDSPRELLAHSLFCQTHHENYWLTPSSARLTTRTIGSLPLLPDSPRELLAHFLFCQTHHENYLLTPSSASLTTRTICSLPLLPVSPRELSAHSLFCQSHHKNYQLTPFSSSLSTTTHQLQCPAKCCNNCNNLGGYTLKPESTHYIGKKGKVVPVHAMKAYRGAEV
jgi:hypothetical protein